MSDLTVDRGFIDVNTCFGPDHGTSRTSGAPLALLVAERRAHGIAASLTYSLVAVAADAESGNRLAFEAAADPANGVLPVAVVAPRNTRHLASQVAEAARSGAIAFLFAGRIGSAMESTATMEILAAVARADRPLLVGLVEYGQASAIGAITEHLGIPVVLLGAHYSHVIDDLAAVARYSHLYLETSALGHFRAVETAVAAVGPEHLLFGSGSPQRPVGAALNAVLCAAISGEAKRTILASNAVRLFGYRPKAKPELSPPGFPERAYDVHGHLGPFGFDVPPVADDAVLDALRIAPVMKAVASSAAAIFGQPVAGNVQAARASAGTNDQRGYVVVDPNDVEFSTTELRRHLGRHGVVGVKIHGQWSEAPTASRMMVDLFDRLARFERPVKIHNYGNDWDDALLEIARRHPRLPIIIAHGGLGTPSLVGARVSARAERVYYEMSSSFPNLAEVRRAVATVPRERLLWGSDAPLLEPAYVYGTYQDAGIAAEAMDLAFWRNAYELFER